MLYSFSFLVVAMTCATTATSATPTVPFTWPPTQGSMSDFEYNLRYGCGFMTWCGGFDGGCEAEVLQPTMPHRFAEHLLIYLGDVSASVKGNKAGLARVPIASVFASRAI
ncbi:hypothetical protein CPAR01_12428 [Colletotrichum paranaense]|uniref:Uncharacterized protein n=1 Tax=Colletotrichum paranaense TaxID=1914294 RepID=A0ABQ9S6E0_9PEZI|nr:uncharacterized protein CPAR01_12428 [Colletotrichum paranaense]KAK1527870.1 hypothetical protein CPAR01_12428 [Colletotrichum paranaense]